jgi:hypothetical protein
LISTSTPIQIVESIPRLSVFRLERGIYEYEVSLGGQRLFGEGGYDGISEAIRHAIVTNPPFVGFEVAYAGYLVGTFTHHELTSNAEAVAEQAVTTKAKFQHS